MRKTGKNQPEPGEILLERLDFVWLHLKKPLIAAIIAGIASITGIIASIIPGIASIILVI